MIALIPLAGNSQRFLDAGYLTPKPFLPLPDGRTMIETIADTLAPSVETIVTICKKDNLELLRSSIGKHAPEKWKHAGRISEPTKGPLDTILRMKSFINYKQELLINFCDCWLPSDSGDQIAEFVEEMHNKKRESGVVVFPSNDPRFQREPTNRYAMSGIFWFKDASRFVKEAMPYRDNPSIGPGHLAFMYRQWMISQAGAFVTNNYVDLGIPESYEFYKTVNTRKVIEGPHISFTNEMIEKQRAKDLENTEDDKSI